MHILLFSEADDMPDVRACIEAAERCGAGIAVSNYGEQYPVDVVIERARWATHCFVLARDGGCLSAQLAVCVALGVKIITDLRWLEDNDPSMVTEVRHVTKGVGYKVLSSYGAGCERAYIVRLVMLARSCTEVQDLQHITISVSDVSRATDHPTLLWPAFVEWLWEGGPISDYVAPPARDPQVAFMSTPGGTLKTTVHLLTPRTGRLLKVPKKGSRTAVRELPLPVDLPRMPSLSTELESELE
eukprot:TRINITY_DN34158_c0_g1_i1.p1 TRINITY_DN34158_c0_g1~~TRINITY_DN34158_c0_g1_i1.p1  ORF type:complete len:256 (+),score=39.79 TRINITY_DN34158_c0_g1_i1:42-770(+)